MALAVDGGVFHARLLPRGVIKSWAPPQDARHLPPSAAGDLSTHHVLVEAVLFIPTAGGEANWMWMAGDGVDGEKLLNASPALLCTLVYFTQIPEWRLPAKVIDSLDFSIRKITSVAGF